MIRMCVYVHLCVWEKLDLLFEPCVACQLVRATSCILLHILAVWIGVVGPPVVLVIAQACGSGERLEKGQSGRKKLSAISMPPLSHTQSQQSHLPHALHPSAGVANGSGLGHLLPALLLCVCGMCVLHVLLCLSMYSKARKDNSANKCTPCTIVYLVN